VGSGQSAGVIAGTGNGVEDCALATVVLAHQGNPEPVFAAVNVFVPGQFLSGSGYLHKLE